MNGLLKTFIPRVVEIFQEGNKKYFENISILYT